MVSRNTSLIPNAKNRIVGTPDYIAPEILNGQSVQNPSLDWWSFGVLCYEFIVGIPPFNDETPEKIFQNILSRNITWPEIGDGDDKMSERAYDLINRLLDMNYETRLGCKGAREIKEHPFFNGINW